MKRIIKNLSYFFASVGYVGFFPKAPGTMGSLATLPMVWYISQYYGLEGLWGLILTAYILGVVVTKEVLKYTKHDPSFIVIDEVAGQAITFCLVPQMLGNWVVYVIGFFLFRIFDIFKMGPVKWADRKMENEVGVMLDDVFAGLIGAVILWAMMQYEPLVNLLS